MKTIKILLCLFILSPVFGQKVTADFDESTDFSKYKTYSFLGWQKDSDQLLNDFDKDRLMTAFRAEMIARGLTRVESGGDLATTLYLVLNQETSTTAYTNYYGGTGYRYRRGGYGWGNGYASTNYSENDYIKGTLVVDFHDSATKDLVWQGVASGTVSENPQKREKKIPKTVKKLMKKYPVDPAK